MVCDGDHTMYELALKVAGCAMLEKVLEAVLLSLDQYLQSSLLSFAGLDEEKLSALARMKGEETEMAEKDKSATKCENKTFSFSDTVMSALDGVIDHVGDETSFVLRANIMSSCRRVEETLVSRMNEIQIAKESVCRAYESAISNMHDQHRAMQIDMTNRQNVKSQADRITTDQVRRSRRLLEDQLTACRSKLHAIKRKLLELQKQQDRSEAEVRK
eukprot:764602-Hanusia_phi.AAC.1